MTNFTTKLAAIVCTILLSATCITAAVGPAEAGVAQNIAGPVVSAARVA